jgi:dinuclear metal center YbgI/SA1388 family protein
MPALRHITKIQSIAIFCSIGSRNSEMITIKNITQHLEQFAPLQLQESYDNSGLITGNPNWEVKGIIVCLDSTEMVIEEAIKHGCNLVVAHHPIIFSGLKKITGKSYVERTIISAIKNDIAIYAVHTNLDNVKDGVNKIICEKLGLQNISILSPKKGLLRKIVTYCPLEQAEKVRAALFEAGAGALGNSDECSFNIPGDGTFRPNEAADPYIGTAGIRHTEKEIRMEMIYQENRQSTILQALFNAHPYEEVAYDIYNLANKDQETGSGMIGELPENQSETEFLKRLKISMKTDCIRYAALSGQEIKKVAVCGGSGSFLLNEAINAGAQAFITADFKYHQFFDAEGKILIADIGHYESEQFTTELIKSLILKKFTTFAVRITEVNTNPVQYM